MRVVATPSIVPASLLFGSAIQRSICRTSSPAAPSPPESAERRRRRVRSRRQRVRLSADADPGRLAVGQHTHGLLLGARDLRVGEVGVGQPAGPRGQREAALDREADIAVARRAQRRDDEAHRELPAAHVRELLGGLAQRVLVVRAAADHQHRDDDHDGGDRGRDRDRGPFHGAGVVVEAGSSALVRAWSSPAGSSRWSGLWRRRLGGSGLRRGLRRRLGLPPAWSSSRSGRRDRPAPRRRGRSACRAGPLVPTGTRSLARMSRTSAAKRVRARADLLVGQLAVLLLELRELSADRREAIRGRAW